MNRPSPFVLIWVAVCILSSLIVRAQEDLRSPSSFTVDADSRKVSWSSVDNAIAYVVAWGKCQKGERCYWHAGPNPAAGGASTRRVSASSNSSTLPHLSGWYGVSVHPIGDGVNFREYSSVHATWVFFESGTSSGSGQSENGTSARIQVDTCNQLPPAIVVTARAGSYPQCNRLDDAGIGVQSIIDSGYIDAVNVWSLVSGGVEVCFRETGDFLFLDAAFPPRAVSRLEGYLSEGMTCVEIDRPGSLVLIPGEPARPRPGLHGYQQRLSCWMPK